MDFTPGVLDILRTGPDGTPPADHEARIRTTVAKQLALYVVLWSPMQMAADLIENYRYHPAFPFIRDVAVNWEETRVLEGAIGDYVVVARRARDRDDEWYVGAITDEEARTFELTLDFLDPERRYVAEIYGDGAGAHWLDNPMPLTVTQREVDARTALQVQLAPGGGQAIRIRPIS
jgi:alpha-glucosidase